MIGGSGFGGVLAIMLGVLKIPLDDCFKFMQFIFSVKGENKDIRTIHLTDIITNFVKKYGGESMLMSENTGTKVSVDGSYFLKLL